MTQGVPITPPPSIPSPRFTPLTPPTNLQKVFRERWPGDEASLAYRLGFPRVTIWRYMRGKSPVPAHVLHELAHLFSCDIQDLL